MEVSCLIQRSNIPARKRSRYDVDDRANLGYVNYIPKKLCVNQEPFITDYNTVRTIPQYTSYTAGNPNPRDGNLSNPPTGPVRFSGSMPNNHINSATFVVSPLNAVPFSNQSNVCNFIPNNPSNVNLIRNQKNGINVNLIRNQKNGVNVNLIRNQQKGVNINLIRNQQNDVNVNLIRNHQNVKCAPNATKQITDHQEYCVKFSSDAKISSEPSSAKFSSDAKLSIQTASAKFSSDTKLSNQPGSAILCSSSPADFDLNTRPSSAKDSSSFQASFDLNIQPDADEFSNSSPENFDLNSHPNSAEFSNTAPQNDVSHTTKPNAGNFINNEDQQLLHQIDLDAELKQERARRIKEHNQLLNSRKLSLVLDLDLTLLNSTTFSEVNKFTPKLEDTLKKRHNDGSIQDMYRIPQMKLWTKLRPGVRQFLAKASQLFELHICTMGNRAYAKAMAKLLDPTGKLFDGRIIAKGSDDGNENDPAEMVQKTKDLEGVLGLESSVIIVDDSSQVWPYHRFNLLQIERYMYFPSTRKQFNLAGPSLFDIGHDENVHNGTLASMLRVLENIHHDFFSNNDQIHEQRVMNSMSEKDARCVLASEKKKVLAGCKIVFSRVFPQGETRPHLHPLWIKAQEFGAQCTMVIDDSVTHVVATSRGTDKVLWALQNGRACVNPTWIEASTYLYRRFKEQHFPVPQ